MSTPTSPIIPTTPDEASGNELIDLVEPWLYSRLSGDAELVELTNGNIVGHLAAGEIQGAYVWYEVADTRDRILPGGNKIWVDAEYEIVAAAATASWLDVKPAAARMMTVLTMPQSTVVELPLGNLEFWRTAPVQYPQTVQGVQYRFLGARYHVRAYYT